MKLLTLAIALLCLSPTARAVLITDTPERLVFDVTWEHGWWTCDGGGLGENGSRVVNMGNEWSRNRYKFLFEVRWMIDGVVLPTTVFQIVFRTNPEDNSPLTTPVLGSPGFIQESPWALPIPGNPHGVRIIRGAPYPDAQAVPEGGGTVPMLGFAMGCLIALFLRSPYGR